MIFEYQGVAPVGFHQPLPRNDLKCVPAHVIPFSCGHYRSTAGTGSLAFLAARPFTLSFAHNNAELEGYLLGRCNALGVSIALDGQQAVIAEQSSSAMGCFGLPQTDDLHVSDFFRKVLTYRVEGRSVVFSSNDATATFTR